MSLIEQPASVGSGDGSPDCHADCQLVPDQAESAGRADEVIGWRCSALLLMAVACIRFVYAFDREIVRMSPDEYATLGMGRFLAGGTWNMFGASTWRPGLSVLMTPLHLITTNQEVIFRGGLVINSILGGASAVLLVRLGRLLTDLTSQQLWWSALLVSLTPASLSASAHLWAEPLVTVTFLGSLLLLHKVFTQSSVRWGFMAVGVASFGFLSHSRMLPMLGLVACIVIAIFVSRQRFLPALTVAAATVGAVAAVHAFSTWIYENVYDVVGSTNSVGSTAERITDPLRVLGAALSQAWYLLATTCLLVGFGCFAIAQRLRAAREPAQRWIAGCVAVSTLLLFGVSALFMSGRVRGDHVIYGRYNDAIIGPVLLMGVAWLLRSVPTAARRELAWVVGVCVALVVDLALFVQQLHGLQFQTTGKVGEMVAGMLPVLTFSSAPNLVLLSVGSAAVGAAAVSMARSREHRVLLVVATIVLALAGTAAWTFRRHQRNVWTQAATVVEIRDFLEGSEPIGFSIVMPEFGAQADPLAQQTWGYSFQWYLPGVEFRTDRGLNDGVGPFVFAGHNDIFMNLSGSEVVWSHPASGFNLWRQAPGATNETVYEVIRRCEGVIMGDEPRRPDCDFDRLIEATSDAP